MNAHDIIVKPILTEKAYDLIPVKTYTFQVAKSATKTQIKAAVEELFEVKVKTVRTVVVAGKLKRMGRSVGYTSDYKKAIVELTDDSKAIEFFASLS